MSVNKYQPHIVVLPEDDANNALINGFLQHDKIVLRAIQSLPCPGGWSVVKSKFESHYLPELRKNENRHVVLLVDFDRNPDRYEKMTESVPSDLRERVFVIGVWSEPEEIGRENLGSKEAVGKRLAEECYQRKRELWNHPLLNHNASELERMGKLLWTILFPE